MGANCLQGEEISYNSWLQGFSLLDIIIGIGSLTAIKGR